MSTQELKSNLSELKSSMSEMKSSLSSHLVAAANAANHHHHPAKFTSAGLLQGTQLCTNLQLWIEMIDSFFMYYRFA